MHWNHIHHASFVRLIPERTKVFTNLVQVVLYRGKLGDSSLENCLVEFDGINTLVLILNLRVKNFAASD